MQLASFLAPPLKTMDSILQVGRESLGLADTGFVLDLHFRVVQVRLWGTSAHFDGVQFVYQHCITEEEREGIAVKTDACSATSPPQSEIGLLEEEFIVDARGLSAHDGATIITTIELITSAGRRFQVGAAIRNASDISVRNTGGEVREVRGRLSPAGDVFMSISPVTAIHPSPRTIQAAVDDAVQLSSTKWWYPERCEQLAVQLRDVGRAVEGVVGRGVVYPVGILCEFGEVAQLGKAVIESCGQPLSVDYFVPRGLVIDGYIQRLSVLKDRIQDRVPKAELTTLEMGDPVEQQDNHTVPRMIRQALKKDQRAIAIALFCKYPKFLVADETLLHRMIELLIETDDSSRIVDVVEAYAQTAQVPVGTLMARYRTRQPSLVERAVYREQANLLEWLVREADLDPFCSSTPGEHRVTLAIDNGVSTDADTPDKRILQRQEKSERLFELVECVKDTDAQKRMHSLLSHMKKKDDFQDGLLALASQDQPTARQFHELVSHITSVYDLPLLFSQAQSCLFDDKRGLTMLIRAACSHVIEKKLVLDTMASAFFNVALSQASEHEYLTPLEYEQYRILNSQINMETAAWVVELKRSTDHVQWRVNRIDDQVESLQRNVSNLRESLRRNEEIELNRRRCRRNWALVSSMLVMVGGGQAVYALQDMFEPVDPTLLISASDDDFMGDMKKTATGLLTGSTDVNSLISRFTSGNALIGDHQPEQEPDAFPGANILRGLGVENSKTAEIVNMLSTAAELCNLKPAIQQKRVAFDERQLQLHPYHNAVYESQGDLQQFKVLERALPPGADINDEFEMTVTKLHDDGASTTKTSRMSAYLYASHMGFVDIVEYLLTNKNLRKREWKLTTKRRARRAQSSIGTVSTMASVVRRFSASASAPHSQ